MFPWWIKYPVVNNEIQNLDWLIYTVKHLSSEVKNFINLNTIKYADPILWDITSQYEANTVVIDPQTGDAYISTKPVPYGVILSNTDYWTKIYNYTQSLNKLEEQIAVVNEELSPTATGPRTVGQLVWLNGLLYKITSDMNAGDMYVSGSNCTKTTIEEEMRLIFDTINGIIGNLSSLSTTDKSSIVAAINEVLAYMGELSSLSTTDKSSIVAAINELETRISRISNYIFYPEVFGAKGDKVTDDTAAIQAMFDAMPQGSTAMFTSPTGYLITDTINIDMGNLIVCGGDGQTEYKKELTLNGNTTMFNVTKAGVIFTNLDFKSSNKTGICINFTGDVNGDTDGIIRNCTFSQFNKNMVLQGKNILVENCLIAGCNMGIEINPTVLDTENRGYVIINNRFHGCSTGVRYNIDQANNYRHECVVKNNIFDFGDTLFIGYSGANISNNTIQYVGTITPTGVRGIIILNSTAERITKISDNYLTCLITQSSPSLTIGIDSRDHGIVVIQNNTIEGFLDEGIICRNGDIVVKNNTINKTSYGIVIDASCTSGIVTQNVGFNVGQDITSPNPPASVTVSDNTRIV